MFAVIKLIGSLLPSKPESLRPPKVPLDVPSFDEVWYRIIDEDDFKLNTYYEIREYEVICMVHKVEEGKYVLMITKDKVFVQCYRLKLSREASFPPSSTDIMLYTKHQ